MNISFSPDGQVICYSEGDEYDPFGFGDYDESDNNNVDCTNGFEGLVSYISSQFLSIIFVSNVIRIIFFRKLHWTILKIIANLRLDPWIQMNILESGLVPFQGCRLFQFYDISNY